MVKAIILCAGEGTRLEPLTNSKPKPMIEVNGKPFLQFHIETLKKHGITDIGINLSHFPEQIKNYFGDGSKFGVNIVYSFEKELLGTAGALNGFRDFIDDTFFVIYGDVAHNANLTEMLNQHREKKSFATLGVSNKVKVDGACVIEGDRIVDFVEKPKLEIPNAVANASIFIVEPEILKYIPDEGFADYGYDVHPQITKNELVHPFDIGPFIDIGTHDGLERARDFLERL